jgi:DNA-directed RNA polymerase subunit RPC12/RpoP
MGDLAMEELFDTAAFSSKNDAIRDFEIESISSKKKVQRSPYKSDSAWDDGSAFPEISFVTSMPEGITETEKRIWAVGDRFQSKWDKSAICTLVKIRDSGKKPYTVEWDNKRKVHCDESWFDEMKFLEEEGAIASCYFYTPVSSQVSEVLNLESKPAKQTTSSLQDYSSKITPTLNVSSATDFLVSPSTAISKTTTLNLENLTSTQSAFLAPVPALQAMEQDLNTQNQNSGLKPCGASPMVAPTSSSLKILQDLSTKDYEQFLEDSEWLVMSGMIRKSYQLRNSDRPKKGKDFSSLPTPTTYAKGSTGCRPAGATRLEQKLRPYITKGDKLNPAVPGWMMGFPVGWAEWPLMDTGETVSVQLRFIPEFVTTSTNGGIATTSTPDQSAPSKQQLQLNESVTSLNLLRQIKRSDIELNLYICNSSHCVGKITEVWQTCFTVDWSNEIKCYFWERDDQVIGELAIAPQELVEKFLEDNQPQLCTKCFQVVAKSYTCEKCHKIECTQQSNHVHCPSCKSPLLTLNDGCGTCGWIPENFLEESNEGVGLKQSFKRRQRKGCLYKYIENKKLKSGAIASYPRVIGHRQPDNPTHWRWGFNWEEKVDGEWKGRSIGSVPLGAIALIQSMQNEGVSLEEITSFIKRAKSKKS